MSFQIVHDPFDQAYVRFSLRIREAIQKTFNEESQNGLTQREIADALGIDESAVSRRIHGPGNITLRTLSDLYTAMGRIPLSNFEMPKVGLFINSAISSSKDGENYIQTDNDQGLRARTEPMIELNDDQNYVLTVGA